MWVKRGESLKDTSACVFGARPTFSPNFLFLFSRRDRFGGRVRQSLFPWSGEGRPDGILRLQPGRVHLPGKVGRTKQGDLLVRQHRAGHAYSLPVRLDGRMDANSILGKVVWSKSEITLVDSASWPPA